MSDKLIQRAYRFYRRRGFRHTLIKMIDPRLPMPEGGMDGQLMPRAGRTWSNADHTRGYVYEEDFKDSEILEAIENFTHKPLISIVMPVYNIAPKWLSLAIKSLEDQLYTNWELCIADDCSPSKKTRDYLKSINDPRIKIAYLEENEGISGASNTAASLAVGDYIGLLDNDDELTRDALYEVVKKINDEGAEYIYSDEDLMDENGNCFNPHFKSDYNPDLLLCHNYITHFSVVKKEIFEKIGGFKSQYDGAQDYDLILNIVENTKKIAHVRKVLYHWRALPSSTSANPGSKHYAEKAGKDALAAAMKRRGEDAIVTYGNAPFYYALNRKLTSQPKVSIIIPFKDRPDFLERVVGSILAKTSYDNYEIIGVSNNSEEKLTFQIMKEYEEMDSRVRFVEYNVPFNYSKINNYAVREFATGDHILLLNNDMEIINADWLKRLLEHSQRPEVGAVGGKLLYPQGTIQHAGIVMGLGVPQDLAIAGHVHRGVPREYHGYYNRALSLQNFSAVTGACLMVKKSLYDELGGLNEEELKVAYNDVDFCLRLREKNLLNVFTPYCEIYHFESVSRGYEDTDEKKERFTTEIRYMQERHKNVLKDGDPFYNPNLSKETEDFAICPIES